MRSGGVRDRGVGVVVPKSPSGPGNVFYLEDETGRIQVESKDAEFWDGDIRFLEPIRYILLTQHVERDQGGVVRRLMPGDAVYVIGSVEENRGVGRDAGGADRLVLRPSSEWVRPNLLQRLLPTTESKVPGSDIHHVFFLSDSSERSAAIVMRETIRRTWEFALVWAVMSAGLLWVAWAG